MLCHSVFGVVDLPFPQYSVHLLDAPLEQGDLRRAPDGRLSNNLAY